VSHVAETLRLLAQVDLHNFDLVMGMLSQVEQAQLENRLGILNMWVYEHQRWCLLDVTSAHLHTESTR